MRWQSGADAEAMNMFANAITHEAAKKASS